MKIIEDETNNHESDANLSNLEPSIEEIPKRKASVEFIEEMRDIIKGMKHSHFNDAYLNISFEFEEMALELAKVKSLAKRNFD